MLEDDYEKKIVIAYELSGRKKRTFIKNKVAARKMYCEKMYEIELNENL